MRQIICVFKLACRFEISVFSSYTGRTELGFKGIDILSFVCVYKILIVFYFELDEMNGEKGLFILFLFLLDSMLMIGEAYVVSEKWLRVLYIFKIYSLRP